MIRSCPHTTFTPVPGCESCQKVVKGYDEMTLGELLREWLMLQLPTTSN
jgi:hypothetical protein